jgi:endonuclease/exonuclease/phosphatase family metal-dependent hydrolase
VIVASWNVENLFDEVDDGGEYPEFTPAQGWTRAKFWARCDALARVIHSLADGAADILVLEELEGQHTLEVLNGRFLGGLGYRHTFLAPDSVPGVKTAVLSRFPFVRTGLHYPAEGSEPLRPLVEVEVDLGSRSLVVIGNHWKSRIPSPAATEGLRLAAARVLARRITSLEARADRPFIVALGDFNTSLELSRSHADRALVPGGTFDGTSPGLVVFDGRNAAQASRWPGAVWDPWETVTSPPGSYLYQGDWDKLDHAFVAATSLRLTDWRVGGFQVFAFAPAPLAFGVRTPQGVSDHFPVVLTLVRPAEGVSLP